MVYPAHLLVTGMVGLAFLVWLALIIWAVRSGLLSRQGEQAKYRVFEEEQEEQR